MVTNSRYERAQLVLVTAITIAFIILGIVVVFNSVLFTQTISSGSGIESTAETERTTIEIEHSIDELVHTVNVHDESDIDSALSDSVSQWDNVFTDVKAAARGVGIVNITVSRNETGYALTEGLTGNYTIEYDDGASVGHTQFEIDIDSLSDGALTIGLNDTEAGYEEYQISVDGDTVIIDEVCELYPDTSQKTLTLDFVTGWADAPTDASCELALISRETAYSMIEFSVDGEVTANFETILHVTDAGQVTVNGPENGDTDLREVAWSVDITYAYIGTDIVVSSDTFTVHPYGDGQ